MKITIERFVSDDDATLGLLFIDDAFECFTLEDQYQAVKVAKETRIPAGTYKAALRNVGGMTKRYAERYPDIHRGMLWLQNVPGFEWIYIHVGNTDDHTEGCILVARNATTGDRLTIPRSADAYRQLYEKVVDAADIRNLDVEIIDRDRMEDAE